MTEQTDCGGHDEHAEGFHCPFGSTITKTGRDVAEIKSSMLGNGHMGMSSKVRMLWSWSGKVIGFFSAVLLAIISGVIALAVSVLGH